MFVSVLDARYPISEDYDFKSDNLGPDSVTITSEDNIWARNMYNKSVGITFVVGIKAMSDNANFSLVMLGPDIQSTPMINLVAAT